LVIRQLEGYCTGAAAAVERCRRAAHGHAADTATLASEAHSMKSGASACSAVDLVKACARLEDFANVSPPPPGMPAAATDWTLLVGSVAVELGNVANYVKAVGALHMVPLLGRAVQVDPMKPQLKAPGTKRLKLNYDAPLSSFAFNFSLRHYTWSFRTATPSAPSCPPCWRRRSRQGSAG
jgi:HPt (histidine-containing phosphotransfer) domain-containing protein